MTMVEIEIKPHATSPLHRVAIVTTSRGYVYACTYAPMDEELTEEFIRREWRESRRHFQPYDTSAGRFVEHDGAKEQ